MSVKETELKGCFVLEPTVFKDSRGYFFESFNRQRFRERTDLDIQFVQDNESKSSKGVLRGLHFQTGAYAQAKLVRVAQGTVYDVVVDIRPQSTTFGQYFGIELSEHNKKQLFIPRGFAHGFVVLSDSATFIYKCDNYYHKEAECGIIFNDPVLNIDWKVSLDELIISDKDLQLPKFQDLGL
jgi:dTDP-4-dehydrorhamnose 3,5-epimerase